MPKNQISAFSSFGNQRRRAAKPDLINAIPGFYPVSKSQPRDRVSVSNWTLGWAVIPMLVQPGGGFCGKRLRLGATFCRYVGAQTFG